MSYLGPSADQVEAFRNHPYEGKIWMLNLLRFASSEARDSYQRYVESVTALLDDRGGRILLRSRGEATMIGPDAWDEVVLIEYPSRTAFLEMVSSEEYAAIAHFRQDAIEDSRLYMTSEMSIPA